MMAESEENNISLKQEIKGVEEEEEEEEFLVPRKRLRTEKTEGIIIFKNNCTHVFIILF